MSETFFKNQTKKLKQPTASYPQLKLKITYPNYQNPSIKILSECEVNFRCVWVCARMGLNLLQMRLSLVGAELTSFWFPLVAIFKNYWFLIKSTLTASMILPADTVRHLLSSVSQCLAQIFCPQTHATNEETIKKVPGEPIAKLLYSHQLADPTGNHFNATPEFWQI